MINKIYGEVGDEFRYWRMVYEVGTRWPRILISMTNLPIYFHRCRKVCVDLAFTHDTCLSTREFSVHPSLVIGFCHTQHGRSIKAAFCGIEVNSCRAEVVVLARQSGCLQVVRTVTELVVFLETSINVHHSVPEWWEKLQETTKSTGNMVSCRCSL